MSGSHEQIIAACAQHVDEGHRDLFLSMFEFVLKSQMVAPPFLCDEVFWVTTGTGMGLSCSGDLSNVTFWSMAETDYVDSDAVRTRFSVYDYLMNMDGIFMVASACGLWRQFIAELDRRARFFCSD